MVIKVIYRKIPHYDFGVLDFLNVKNGAFLKHSFYLELPILQQEYDSEKVLFAVENSLELRVIKRSYYDDVEDMLSLRSEGCFYFNEENEWILEAKMFMCLPDGSGKETYRLCLPLSAPFVKSVNIGIYFDGSFIRFMANGEILNENSGLDCFYYDGGKVVISDDFKGIKVAQVKNVKLTYREEKSDVSPAFYFPHGLNSYVGDVMSFYHNGIYHLMYLIDRRHHGSRNGCGAHYICHLTSENLTDWWEQEPIAKIDKPWITYGTGTMLYHNEKYYMTYGLHTERYKGTEPKITPEFNKENQTFTNIRFEEVIEKGGLPTGASYSYSYDGITFKPSNILFHSARNPSAYKNSEGGITLYCGYGGEGVYESSSFDKPFKRSDYNFDYVKSSVMRSTSECPAFFDWNGYKYLIIGFTGYFRTLKKGSADFVDAAALGENIYDGLSVPMVAEFAGERRIIAGWVESPWGWGGVLMQRELVQEENGKLGMKWIPELSPKPQSEYRLQYKNDIFDGIELEKTKSYYLELQVNPKTAKRLGLSFSNRKNTCVLELDFENNRMQINDASIGEFGAKIPTNLEQMSDVMTNIKRIKNIPRGAKNYSLPDIAGINEPFCFKLILRYSKKMRSTVIDAEIAERRTMISVRNGFYPTKITTLKDGDLDVKIVSIYEIQTVE